MTKNVGNLAASIPATIPVGLTESYATEKAHQWNAFLKRSQLEAPPLDEVVAGKAYLGN